MNRRSSAADLNQALRTSYWREEEARVVLDSCLASGLSIAAFAEEHGLRPERLYRWQRRLDRDSDLSFHPVEVVESRPVAGLADHGEAPQPSSDVELILRNGRRIRVGRSYDRDLLRDLVETLESWSC